MNINVQSFVHILTNAKVLVPNFALVVPCENQIVMFCNISYLSSSGVCYVPLYYKSQNFVA